MKSTGEVMGLDRDYASPSPRASSAAAPGCRKDGTVFVSVRDGDKPRILEALKAAARRSDSR